MNALTLPMEDLLGSLGKEQEQEKREFDVDQNPVLEEMCKGFEAVLPHTSRVNHELYELCMKQITNSYRAKDIERFSVVLAQYQFDPWFDFGAGVFLSALVNQCPDENVTLFTKHLKNDMQGIGYENDHTLVVQGNAGAYLGQCMTAGEIVVIGNVGLYVGASMQGGIIRVEGDAEKYVGCGMFDGVIQIGGQMEINGEHMKGGDIYHKDKLIVKDGKKV